MAILKHGIVQINGLTISYEGEIKATDGSPTLKFNPQVNGSAIITTDISTNFSEIIIPVRNTDANDKMFDDFYNQNNGNHVISFKNKNYSGCMLVVKPQRQDMAITEYVFHGNPAI